MIAFRPRNTKVPTHSFGKYRWIGSYRFVTTVWNVMNSFIYPIFITFLLDHTCWWWSNGAIGLEIKKCVMIKVLGLISSVVANIVATDSCMMTCLNTSQQGDSAAISLITALIYSCENWESSRSSMFIFAQFRILKVDVKWCADVQQKCVCQFTMIL